MKRLSRRRARSAAALVAFGAAAALAGCGGGAAPPATSTTVAAHTFTDLVGELPTNLDETGTPDPASATILPSWSSELVRPAPAKAGPNAVLAADDAVVPYLATSWQRSTNGSYTFELRRGVRGDSGDHFSAADVSWSLDRAVARSPVEPFLFALAHIDAHNPVTILNRYRVRVNVTSPSPFTLSVLASYDAGIYDSALYLAHATAQDPWAQSWGSTHSASYGAYWVAAFVPRREIVLEANPGSWRHPYYTTVIIRENTSSAARVAAVLAGTATHTSGLDWSDFESAVDAARADGATATILQTGPAVVGWHLNTASGPLANPQVRQAISLGINRVELANSLDQGYAQPSVLTVPPTFGQAQPTAFDPQQARSLLRAAGYPDGITVSLYTNDGEADDNASAVLKFVYDQMVEIGVVINTTYIQDTDQLLSLARSPGLESTMLTETPLLGGAGFLLEQNANAALDPLSDASEQHYASAALQSSLNQLASSPGGASTQALIGQAASAIDAKTPTINLYAIPVQNVTRAGVTGYAAYTEPVTYYENLRPGG